MPAVPILMKNCVRSAALLCMLLGGNNVFGEIKDVHGWKKAQWGMTEDEVLNVFQGEASRIKPARKVKGLTEKPDALATIEIKTLHILDDKYGAVFIFDENTKKLIKVMLHATSSMASESQFNVLEKSLKGKYGSPAYKNNKRTISGDHLTRSWKFPSTLITLEYQVIQIPLHERHLRIEYCQQNDKAAMDNL